MEKLTAVTKQIMDERFRKDNVISLATSADNMPYVRYVNAYYEQGVLFSKGTRYEIDFMG